MINLNSSTKSWLVWTPCLACMHLKVGWGEVIIVKLQAKSCLGWLCFSPATRTRRRRTSTKIYQKGVYYKSEIWHIDFTYNLKTSTETLSLKVEFDTEDPSLVWRIFCSYIIFVPVIKSLQSICFRLIEHLFILCRKGHFLLVLSLAQLCPSLFSKIGESFSIISQKYQLNSAGGTSSLPAKSKMVPSGSGKVSIPMFLGAPVNFCEISFLIRALLLWEK